MFPNEAGREANTEEPRDERLSALLREWKGVDPQADFEAAVWRRIRTASASEQQRLPLVPTLREWLVARPVWANSMAAAAGIVVAVGLAFFAPEAQQGWGGEPLLHPQTLAGSYLTIVTGGAR